MNIKVIRRYLHSKIGFNIVIIYYGSRNRKERFEGVIYKIYNNVFTIKTVSGDIKCFSYKDIITKTVQIYV